MVAIRAVAREVPVLKPADVRFGSKADIGAGSPDIRFTPKAHQALMSTRPNSERIPQSGSNAEL
jgi:hypothetical protein